jgi:thioredoxin reductase (NADPH)
MKAQAERFGTRVEMENVVEVDFDGPPFVLGPTYGDPVLADSVIVATGARANWLGLPNEERLAQSGGGVSACAVCDGALPALPRPGAGGGGRRRLRDGGGAYLTKFAKEVVIVHRRDELPRVEDHGRPRAREPQDPRRVEHQVVTDVLGDDFITGVRLEDTEDRRTSEDLEVAGSSSPSATRPTPAFLTGSRGPQGERLRRDARAVAHQHLRSRSLRGGRRDGRLLPPGGDRRRDGGAWPRSRPSAGSPTDFTHGGVLLPGSRDRTSRAPP